MALIRAVLGWLARHALLFALIVAGLVAWAMLRPSFDSYGAMRARVAAADAAAAAFPAELARLTGSGGARLAQGQALTIAQIDQRIAAATRQRDVHGREGRGDPAAALITGGAPALLANRRAAAEAALLTREIAVLTQLRDTIGLRRPGEDLAAAVRRQTAQMRAAIAANRRARERIAVIDAVNPVARLRLRGYRATEIAAASQSAADYRNAKANAERLVAARRGIDAARAEADDAIARVNAELSTLAAREGRLLGDNRVAQARGWATRVDLSGKARAALLIVLVIVLTPPLIRTLFYSVLAPIAARRPAIRVRASAGADTALLAPGERSAVSLGVRLGPGEELLVRQGFLQASSVGGEKRTRWLLDWRHPLTSLAAGLWFLTRVRGGTDDVATVSAIADPFAEIAELALPAGAALVLHPRALVAVAQPVAQPLRITSHWRLGSLNAWLTLQLRYLLFHGPARLVVKGGRGVRIEPATRGRILGQDQLVGFSADLAYSVTRTETFWPYLLGRESLLKDRVIDGNGVLVVEEAPLAARGGKGVRGGLEGAFDAALKVFGV